MHISQAFLTAGAILFGVGLWTSPAHALTLGSISGAYVDLGVGENAATVKHREGGANQVAASYTMATDGGGAQAEGFARLAGASLGAESLTSIPAPQFPGCGRPIPCPRTEALATAALWDRIDLIFPTAGVNDFSFTITYEGEETEPTDDAFALGRAKWLFTQNMNYNPAGQPFLVSGGGLHTFVIPMRHVGKTLSLYTYLELQTQARSGGVADFGGSLKLNWDLPQGAILTSHSGALSEAVAGVPEPGSWALMILGFGGAGAMLRRTRRQATPYRLPAWARRAA